MRTSNPAFKRFLEIAATDSQDQMTINGAIHKTLALLVLAIVGASFTWVLAGSNPAAGQTLMIVGAVGGLILAFVTIFSPAKAMLTAPLYAIFEGLLLGGISAYAQAMYPGIALQAVLLTFGTLFALLIAYRSGIVRPTQRFKAGIMAATMAIGLVFVVGFIFSLVGLGRMSIFGSGPIGIVFSLVVVVIAALNLVLDFDFIEQGAKRQIPAHYEWYAAFGLLVTLVWLYFEILHLLMKLQSRD